MKSIIFTIILLFSTTLLIAESKSTTIRTVVQQRKQSIKNFRLLTKAKSPCIVNEREDSMKKFLGTFAAIVTTFANQASFAIEAKPVQPTLSSSEYIVEKISTISSNQKVSDTNKDNELFVLKRPEDTSVIVAGHRSHSSHSSHSSHRSHYSSR